MLPWRRSPTLPAQPTAPDEPEDGVVSPWEATRRFDRCTRKQPGASSRCRSHQQQYARACPLWTASGAPINRKRSLAPDAVRSWLSRRATGGVFDLRVPVEELSDPMTQLSHQAVRRNDRTQGVPRDTAASWPADELHLLDDAWQANCRTPQPTVAWPDRGVRHGASGLAISRPLTRCEPAVNHCKR